tara:strand:+ start:726 stop:2936 length:2211 start_codon:yes stop_codon:yes gene_type:complete
MRYINIFLQAMRRSGYDVSNPSELRDIKKAIAEYYNAGYAPDDPKRLYLDDSLDDWKRIEPFLETQHKQGFITKEFLREVGDIFEDIRESRNVDEIRLDKEADFGRFGGVDVDLVKDIPNETFRNNLIEAFGKSEVEAAIRIKKHSGLEGHDPAEWGIKTSENWEDELVWLLEGRNHPEHPMLYERIDGAASKYIGNKSNPTPPSGGGITSIKDSEFKGNEFDNIFDKMQDMVKSDDPTTSSVGESLDNIADDLGKISESKKKRNKILNDALDEILGPEEVDDLMTDDWVDKRVKEMATQTKIADATTAEIAEAKQAMEMAVEQGRVEEAKTIAEELLRMGVKLDEGGYKSDVPIDMANILKKPEHAKGGRVGLDSGGNPLDKIKMNRRGFLGLMGSGIAAGVAGAKGWLTGGKSAVATAKATAEMTASGMPKWFPLLVDKIRTKGKSKPAAYAEVKDGEPNITVYELKDPNISIEPIRMEENLDTGMIEISGRGNESQLVTMTYYAPETAVNVRTGTRSGAKEGEFVVEEMTKHPEQGWIETGAEDYASLKGGVENWEAAVKSHYKTKAELSNAADEFIDVQRGQPEPFDPDGKFKIGGRVGLEAGGVALYKKNQEERARWMEKLARMKRARLMQMEEDKPGFIRSRLNMLNPWDKDPTGEQAIGDTRFLYDDHISRMKVQQRKEQMDEYLRLLEEDERPQVKTFEAQTGGLVPPKKGPMSNGLGTRFKEKQKWL